MTILSTYLSLFSAPLVDDNATPTSASTSPSSSPSDGSADPYTSPPSVGSSHRKARGSVDVSEPVELHAISRPPRPGMMARARSSLQAIPQYFSRGQAQVVPVQTVRVPPTAAQGGTAEGYPHVQSVASEEGTPLPVNGEGQAR